LANESSQQGRRVSRRQNIGKAPKLLGSQLGDLVEAMAYADSSVGGNGQPMGGTEVFLLNGIYLPVVDFAGWNTEPNRQQIAQDIVAACKNVGFVYIIGLRVPASKVHDRDVGGLGRSHGICRF
jgi:hypothetical protein